MVQAYEIEQVAEKLIIAPVALRRWAILQLRYVAGSKRAIWLFDILMFIQKERPVLH